MSASEIRVGDCVEVMAAMPEASVDAVVCDPPYHLSFMGRSWDHAPTGAESQAMHESWAREALRVLKPGGHLLAFGGTRTFHRLTCAIEDAGFEVRDCLSWMYGSGFPKSLSVSMAIDKAERGHPQGSTTGDPLKRGRGAIPDRNALMMGGGNGGAVTGLTDEYGERVLTSEAAREWEGWGTALKPSWEPIVLARKPLDGTVAANVLEHGTGALNIDGCRIGTSDTIEQSGEKVTMGADTIHAGYDRPGRTMYRTDKPKERSGPADPSGRWPANTVLSHSEGCERVGERRVRTSAPASGPTLTGESTSNARGKFNGVDATPNYADEDGYETTEAWECVEGCPVAELDRQSGESKSSGGSGVASRGALGRNVYGEYEQYDDGKRLGNHGGLGDVGGASRFFYVAKSSRKEREAGLTGELHTFGQSNGTLAAIARGEDYQGPDASTGLNRVKSVRNNHPTVKPIDLMRWLVRLVTPPGGTVCDPFTGSGTTGIACALEGFNFIGIEREQEYVQIAEARIGWWSECPQGISTKDVLKASKTAAPTKAVDEQESLFA